MHEGMYRLLGVSLGWLSALLLIGQKLSCKQFYVRSFICKCERGGSLGQELFRWHDADKTKDNRHYADQLDGTWYNSYIIGSN